ncbi:MAG: hypothetical protein LC797_24075 [Chloroflexi bacterium]|nr:hypothetical protein [Chloroflexota bacterium]
MRGLRTLSPSASTEIASYACVFRVGYTDLLQNLLQNRIKRWRRDATWATIRPILNSNRALWHMLGQGETRFTAIFKTVAPRRCLGRENSSVRRRE